MYLELSLEALYSSISEKTLENNAFQYRFGLTIYYIYEMNHGNIETLVSNGNVFNMDDSGREKNLQSYKK